MYKSKLRRGDLVEVISGNDKGKQGHVMRIIPKQAKVVISGVNVVSKHSKPSKGDPSGGIIKKELPIHISKVLYVDPKVGVPTRVGYKMINGAKLRYAKRSGELIDKQEKVTL